MYVIMCEVRACKQLGFPSAKEKLVSAHPVYAAKDAQEVREWMQREPEIIVQHLDAMQEDVWETGDRTDTWADVWNKAHTVKRTYVAKYVNGEEK